MARISVIIPSYNNALYVGDAIESALNQEFSDVEIIVVDDGSTDSTQDVLKEYSAPPVKVIRQINTGLLGARSRGILESSAPLIYFLDADDILLSGSLHLLFDVMENQPAIGLVTGGTQYVDLDGNVLGFKLSKPGGLEIGDILLNNPITVSGVMIRRSWLDHVGGFETRREFDPTGDWDLWLRLVSGGCKIEWIEKLIVGYRIHPYQMTQDPGRMRDAMFLVLEKFYTNNEIPKSLEDIKPKVYGNVFIKSACRYFLVGMYDTGMNDLSEAICLDPSLPKADFKELINLLIGWAESPQSKGPVEFLENIKNNLPVQLKGLENPLKKAIALVILKPMFVSNSQTRQTGKWEMLKAIRNDFSWLRNRGVLKMLVEAWFPIARRRR